MVMDILFFSFIAIGLFFIVMLFVAESWNLYIGWGDSWRKMAKKGEGFAEELFKEDFGPSDPTHKLRVLFIRGWNKDIDRWNKLADAQYKKVPKWYLKLKGKKC